jgi:hypothetical protein
MLFMTTDVSNQGLVLFRPEVARRHYVRSPQSCPLTGASNPRKGVLITGGYSRVRGSGLVLQRVFKKNKIGEIYSLIYFILLACYVYVRCVGRAMSLIA